MVESHEQAHKQIYENYGVESEIVNHMNPLTKGFYTYLFSFGNEPAGYTQATGNGTCNDICELAHSNNESVGYNNQNIVWALFILTFFFICYKMITSKDMEDDLGV